MSDQNDSQHTSGQQRADFKVCGEKHDFCTIGLGECTMRKGHASWGEKHSCGKCGRSF